MLYREQYNRMKRRHARFAERSVERSMQSLMDDAQAFFESCLHLRDWIKNDEQLPQPVRDAVFRYVTENKILRQCREIAVASKHLKVDHPLPERPRLRSERTTEQLPAELVYGEEDNFLPPETLVHVNFPRVVMETSEGETIDALVFAGDCLQSWDHFFERHGLT